jgi:glycosyltransferase involved in cell wall biosynthesis
MPAVRRRIRVVTLIDLIGPIGGAERLAVLLAEGLDQERFESTVCVTYLRRDDPDALGMEQTARELEAAGVRVIGLGRRKSSDVHVWHRLLAELRGRDIDVLHAHKFGSNVWGAVLGTLARTPVFVAHEHTWSYEGDPVRKLLDRHLIARCADAFVAVSREDQRRMSSVEGIPAARTRYIPNGAPPSVGRNGHDARAELGIPAGAPVVGSVGMLRPQKAFEVLVDAAVPLRAAHPDLRVLIVGHGEEEAQLRARIAAAGLQDTVLLVGHRADVPDLLRSFDVAVTCSDYEGMPVSVLEYMEAERPVVATRVGGLPDLIDDGVHGVLVPPRDPAALAEAVSGLLRDPDRRAAMGAAGRARRQAEFGIDAMVRRVEDLYVELLQRRGRAVE